jgi:hypothetical protein
MLWGIMLPVLPVECCLEGNISVVDCTWVFDLRYRGFLEVELWFGGLKMTIRG